MTAIPRRSPSHAKSKILPSVSNATKTQITPRSIHHPSHYASKCLEPNVRKSSPTTGGLVFVLSFFFFRFFVSFFHLVHLYRPDRKLGKRAVDCGRAGKQRLREDVKRRRGVPLPHRPLVTVSMKLSSSWKYSKVACCSPLLSPIRKCRAKFNSAPVW